jgi:hypothetical protein
VGTETLITGAETATDVAEVVNTGVIMMASVGFAVIAAGSNVTVGVKVKVGNISSVGNCDTFCVNSAITVSATVVLTAPESDVGMLGIAHAKLVASISVNAK